MLKSIANAASIFAETLREIFDENSYARFLARSGFEDSQTAYAEFLHQEAQQRERCPRCC